MVKTDTDRIARAAVQMLAGMGHNGPPKPRSKLFGLKAAWVKYANKSELKRLAKLHVRMELKEQALADLREERTRIMNCCIKRMRREAGKN
jgi:hypothetical protein